MFRRACVLACVASLSGCATTPTVATAPAWMPIVDSRHLNQARYSRDLADCQAQAQAVPGANGREETKKGAVKGGLAVAALMGVGVLATGGLAALPMMAGAAASTAGVGAVAGGLSGKAVADSKYKGSVMTCLEGRGYHVLE